MNTVHIFLASVEFGDGPFALANMILGESTTAKREILERDI
jgi:hypothetical protein